MTLCFYSLPPQNPSIHVNSRQELLTIYLISIPGNHQGHQKQGESVKLLQPKEDFGGKTTKYEAISWTESLAEKHRKCASMSGNQGGIWGTSMDCSWGTEYLPRVIF